MCPLHVVATPIGNLEDITLRAIRVLKEADVIAAEDTRHTRKLLTHYGITTRMTSYHAHNEKEKAAVILESLKNGEDVALVSDAGTPGISDPGYRLIRLAIENSIPVVSVPGPSAVAAVLCVAGLPMTEFTFKGFVPSTSGKRKKFIEELKHTGSTFVMYESPRRIKATLAQVLDSLGDIEVVVAREMTKLHEEVLRGSVSSVIQGLEDREPKGEITLVLRTGGAERSGIDPEAELERLLTSGESVKDAVKIVSGLCGHTRREIYNMALAVRERLGL